MNDQEYEIYNGENTQNYANRHIFRFIASNSHLPLYLDIFVDSNSSSLCINVISKNIEVDINNLSTSFRQDKGTFNDHYFNIDENVLNIPRFNALYENEENSSECRKVIFDNYLYIHDVDLSYSPINPHAQSQIIF